MSPARQRLGKQVRSIVWRNAPLQNGTGGGGRAVAHPRARLAMQFVWYGAPFSSVVHASVAAEGRGHEIPPVVLHGAGSLLGHTNFKIPTVRQRSHESPLLHNKRQQNKNNCRSVRASQQSVTLTKLMRTSALPSQPLDHPANMSLKQLINALTARGFRQTHWRGVK